MLSRRPSVPRLILGHLGEICFQVALLGVVLCLFVSVFSYGESALDFSNPSTSLLRTRSGYSIAKRVTDGALLSARLIGGSLLLSTTIAVALGWIMAVRPALNVARIPLAVVSALPVFALGYWLRQASDLPHLLLAILAITAGDLVLVAMTSQIADELRREFRRGYLLSARARGAAPFRQYWRRLVVIALESMRPRLPFLLGSSVVVESVFALDGLGLLAVDSVRNGEVATILWLAILALIVVRVASLSIDLIRAVLTPEPSVRRQANPTGIRDLVTQSFAGIAMFLGRKEVGAFGGRYSISGEISEVSDDGISTSSRLRAFTGWERVTVFVGMGLLSLSVAFILFCFLVSPDRTAVAGNALNSQFQSPSADHWLGLDENGRDILVRIRVAGRMLVPPALATLVIVIAVATPFGLLSGYYESHVARLVERLFDVLDSVPKLVLVLLAIVVFEVEGAYLWKIIPFIGLTFAPVIFYQVRESALLLRQRLFVERARSLGCSEPRIVFLHILWMNCRHRILIASSFILGGIILMDASIGYLNLSQPDYPTWGGLVASGMASADDTRGTDLPFNAWALWGPIGVLVFMLMSFNVAAQALDTLWRKE